MIEINDKNHISVLLSSLDKIYNQGKINGKLEAIDLYILNIIYKLLNNCCLELTNEQRKCLMNSYRNMYFYSNTICQATPIQIYQTNYKTKFFQAESEDCNNYPKFEDIYYWQEPLGRNFANIHPDIVDSTYLIGKSFDTEENFKLGKDIDYSDIGVICFLVTDTLTTDTYKIYDILNNDITHTFNTIYIDSLNSTLFVSSNSYSYGLMNITIKKQTTNLSIGPFNRIFNNTFL